MSPYGEVSYWFDTLAQPLVARPPAPAGLEVDVAIVGGGYTGLWTSYYLRRVAPELSVAVLEREVCGFGASGRNGGWCSALFPVSPHRLRALVGPAAAEALAAAMIDSVDEVRRVAEREHIDCHYAKGGTVVLARSRAELARAMEEVAASRSGVGDPDLELLSADEARRLVGATRVLGGTYTPHCAAIQPARLVRGLATAVARLGGQVYEATPVRSIRPHRLETHAGAVRARFVVRATEGYSAGLAGSGRELAPVYSLMLATEPLPAEVIESIGLARRETFSDGRRLIIYGQRTADDRIAFGGRGAPYHLGSRVDQRYERVPRVHRAIHAALLDLFPQLAGHRISHAWGGPLGVPRDWFPSVRLDRESGLGSAGGYVGDGVATSNLAGRVMADLIAERATDLTTLAIVEHRSPQWEREPLRFLGVNAGLAAMTYADWSERKTGRQSLVARKLGPLLGE